MASNKYCVIMAGGIGSRFWLRSPVSPFGSFGINIADIVINMIQVINTHQNNNRCIVLNLIFYLRHSCRYHPVISHRRKTGPNAVIIYRIPQSLCSGISDKYQFICGDSIRMIWLA